MISKRSMGAKTKLIKFENEKAIRPLRKKFVGENMGQETVYNMIPKPYVRAPRDPNLYDKKGRLYKWKPPKRPQTQKIKTRKAPTPKIDEKPVIIKKAKTNFKDRNRRELKTMRPKSAVKAPPKQYKKKKTYGKTPKYLKKFIAQAEERKERDLRRE